jgi:serine/threonine protein kinase/WD40 repeat protein
VFDQNAHPELATLDDFAHGRLEESLSGEVEVHLQSCDDCCRHLEDLPSSGDRFVRELRSLAQSPQAPSDAIGRSQVPSRIGRFEVRETIGEGGFGIVLSAYDPNLQRDVAIKIPRHGSFLPPDLRARFLREARAAAGLDHPNIMPIYEAGEESGTCYIAAAYCRGPTLAAWIRGRADLVPFQLAARLAMELSGAIQHAHSRGVYHRDLKPSNVLLEPLTAESPADGGLSTNGSGWGFVLRITDFGLAKLDGDDRAVTRSNLVMGTASYMAPEQASGKGPVGPAVDIYALGAILYELLTGRPPFVSDSELETLLRVRDEEPVPPSRLRPRTPRDLETICLTCLAKDPRRRYADAQSLQADLRRFLSGEPIHARPTSQLEHALRWCRRNPLATALAACLVVALLTIAGVSTAMSLRLNREALRSFAAEVESKRHLWDSYLASTRAARTSKTQGQRIESLNQLQAAARLASELNLGEDARLRMRNEAIASLALADLALETQWPADVDKHDPRKISFDRDLERAALVNSNDEIVIRTLNAAGKDVQLRTNGRVEMLALNFDGKCLAALVAANDLMRVDLWRLDEGPRSRTVAHQIKPVCLSWHPSANRMGMVDSDGNVWLYDIDSDRLTNCAHAMGASRGCCFDLLGASMAIWSGSSIDVVNLNAKGGSKRFKHPGGDQVQSVAFSPDGYWLASGGSHHAAYIWHLGEADWRHELQGHQGWVNHVAFTSSGWLATSSSDGTTRLWEVQTGRELVGGRGFGMRFDTAGNRMAGLFGRNLALFRVTGAAERQTCRGPASRYEAYAADITSDGELMASVDSHGIDFWNCHDGSFLRRLDLSGVCWLGFRRGESNRHELITGSNHGPQIRSIHWQAVAGKLTIDEPRSVKAPQAFRHPFRAALASESLVLLNAGGNACVIDLAGKQQPVLICHPELDEAAISADGTWIVTFDTTGKGLEIWNAQTGAHVASLLPDSRIQGAAFSPNGSILAVNVAAELLIFDARTWKIRQRIVWDSNVAGTTTSCGLSFTSRGDLVAVWRGGYEIKLVGVREGKILATLPADVPHGNMYFSPDGSTLACTGSDLTLQIWRLGTVRNQLEHLGLNW